MDGEEEGWRRRRDEERTWAAARKGSGRVRCDEEGSTWRRGTEEGGGREATEEGSRVAAVRVRRQGQQLLRRTRVPSR
ncbi:unnamed protein product [Linum trigynum]|uniref:Uncharacterized protein n=1 Tax=Linum trigynum TaxID=586398 RepID=A0AAV2ERC5_9ROSI